MKFITIILIVYVLTACSDNETATKEIPKETTLFETQTDALDKAKSVEQSLQNNVNKRDEEMREQGI